MDIRSTVMIMVSGALVATLAGAVPAAAAAPEAVGTPVTTGCPAGQLLSVAELEAEGPYQVPRTLDEAGNGDGLVCGQAYPPAATAQLCPADPCPVPVLYLFRDNDLPARRA